MTIDPHKTLEFDAEGKRKFYKIVNYADLASPYQGMRYLLGGVAKSNRTSTELTAEEQYRNRIDLGIHVFDDLDEAIEKAREKANPIFEGEERLDEDANTVLEVIGRREHLVATGQWTDYGVDNSVFTEVEVPDQTLIPYFNVLSDDEEDDDDFDDDDLDEEDDDFYDDDFYDEDDFDDEDEEEEEEDEACVLP